jgi:hypothetical protein
MVIFSTVIPKLAQQVELMMRELRFGPHLYATRQGPTRACLKY